MSEQIEDLSTEMKIIKNLMEILELQSITIEMKNSLDGFNCKLQW